MQAISAAVYARAHVVWPAGSAVLAAASDLIRAMLLYESHFNGFGKTDKNYRDRREGNHPPGEDSKFS